MSVATTAVLSDRYTDRVKPFFSSDSEFFETRDELYSKLASKLEKLDEKRRNSEGAALVKHYR